MMMPRHSSESSVHSESATVSGVSDVDELARHFRNQGITMVERAPFSAEICAAVAEHPEIIELLLAAPDEQQIPVLLLAAIHDQVLGDPDCELASWYPTVSTSPRNDAVEGALVRHCRTHTDHLRHTIGTRSTQTNEVGRCGLFVPALGLLDAEVGPLALIDIGTSAGLNLRLDQYEYHYQPGGSVGDPSTVRLETGTRGSPPIPAALPTISGRFGLDREPVDLSDPASARWLTACIWPEQADRFRRLSAAIAIALEHPVHVRQGDAVDDLAETIHAADAVAHPVVLNSWVLNYLSAERRDAYVAELERIGAEDDISWVYAESPAQCSGLPFPEEIAGDHVTALMLVTWRRGRRTVDYLGRAHPHGYWLHWAGRPHGGAAAR
jgi:hypothetical protein